MANATAMTLLAVNVGFPSLDAVPEGVADILENDLAAAAAEIAGMGVELDESDASDRNLQVMYAAWLYNKRKTGEAKGEMLASTLRNRRTRHSTEAAP